MYLDWLASLLELLGIWVVGNKDRRGFLVFICCGLCWITYVLVSGSTYGLLLVVVPALFLNLGNFIKWGK